MPHCNVKDFNQIAKNARIQPQHYGKIKPIKWLSPQNPAISITIHSPYTK